MSLDHLVSLAEKHPIIVLARKYYFETLLGIFKKAIKNSSPLQFPISRIVAVVVAMLNRKESTNLSQGLVGLAILDFCCLEDQGKSAFGQFIRLLGPSGPLVSHPVLLSAALNCLGHVLRQRPVTMARGLPILLEWFDLAPRFEGFSPAQRRNVEHTIKNQLASILALGDSTDFTPILNEVLGRRKQQLAATKTASKRSEVPAAPADEAEEKYSKRLKPSAAFAEESNVPAVKLDVTKVIFPTVVSAVLKTCRKLELSMVQAKLEAWRPTKEPVVMDDPRKRGTKDKKTNLYTDDPEDFSTEDFQSHLALNFGRVLDAALRYNIDISRFGDDRRKEWAYLVARYATTIEDQFVESELLNYCFQDLPVRAGLLTLWLRFQWSRHQDPLKYEQIYIRVLSRLESLIELDSTSADLEECLGDVLVFAPGSGLESSMFMFVLRGLGLADQPEPEEGEEPAEPDLPHRALLFRLLKRLLVERPAYRAPAMSLIEELLKQPDGIRSEAIKLCGETLSFDPLGQFYRQLSITEGSIDLFIELLGHDIGLLGSLDPTSLDEEKTKMLIAKLATIIQKIHQEEELEKGFTALVKVCTECHSDILKIVVEAIPTSIAIPSDLFSSIMSRPDPNTCALLSTKLLDRDQTLALLPLLVNQTESKADYVTLVQRLSTASCSPEDLFVELHRLEEQITVKRCIEACSACFAQPSIWKPSVLLGALERLLDEPSLPVTFMRSVIQSLALHPKSLAPGVQSILSRLVTLKVWEQPRQWDGWLRALKMLLPTALPLILQLPVPVVQKVIDAVPEAKGPLKEYLWQQPPSLRNRFSAVISLID